MVLDLVPDVPQMALFQRPDEKLRSLSAAVEQGAGQVRVQSLQRGRTFVLAGHFPSERWGYILKTASLSR
jgi:hypothetical protein